MSVSNDDLKESIFTTAQVESLPKYGQKWIGIDIFLDPGR